MNKQKLSLLKAIIIFLVSTAYFFLLLFTLLPFLKSHYSIDPALYWFITGYFLFIPLFVYALSMVKFEGNRGIKQILLALNIKSFKKRDWTYSVIGLLLVFIFTGLIFGSSLLLNKYLGIRLLTTTPWLQTRLSAKYSWLLCSLLWMIFHLPFGIDFIIMLIPVIIIIPYAFYKTQNTLVGIFIHGIYNGPLFIAVALGLIK